MPLSRMAMPILESPALASGNREGAVVGCAGKATYHACRGTQSSRISARTIPGGRIRTGRCTR